MLTLWRTPTNGLAALSAEMDRLLNDVARPGAWSQGPAPAADVLETEHDFRVVLDAPGLDPAAIKVDVENDTLAIEAERKLIQPEKGVTVHRSERTFGSFHRAFTLPRTVDGAKVEAHYEQGVLTVVLPKREEARPRTIAVQVR